MIHANRTVAKHIYETFPEVAVLRRHPDPVPTDFEDFIDKAKSAGAPH